MAIPLPEHPMIMDYITATSRMNMEEDPVKKAEIAEYRESLMQVLKIGPTKSEAQEQEADENPAEEAEEAEDEPETEETTEGQKKKVVYLSQEGMAVINALSTWINQRNSLVAEKTKAEVEAKEIQMQRMIIDLVASKFVVEGPAEDKAKENPEPTPC